MTKPTIPRTPRVYHEAIDWVSATWMLAVAVLAFYLTAGLLGPGLLQLVIAQLVLGAAVLLMLAQQQLPPRTLGLHAPSGLALLGAVLIGISAWYPNLRLALWVQACLHLPTRVAGLERLLDAPGLLLTAACLAVVPALCEELAFRGLWARAIAARFGVARSVAITAPVFGAYHLAAAQLLPASVLGGVLAWACLRARSLWIAIAIHALNNACAIAAARGGLGSLAGSMQRAPTLALVATLTLSIAGVLLIRARPAASTGAH